jgi:hypothetical protein
MCSARPDRLDDRRDAVFIGAEIRDIDLVVADGTRIIVLFGPGKDVARVGEGGDPAPIDETGIQSAMIDDKYAFPDRRYGRIGISVRKI